MLIRELILETRDLAAQASFWAKTLALPTAVSEQSVEVRLRHSTIRFKCAATGANPRYHFAINIPRGSIEDAATWLEQRHDVLAFHGDPDVADGATIVRTDRGAAALYFLDAVGNVVELIANDHLDNDSGEPFGPDSLLEIAEIGIATEDTEATRAAVQEALDADVLWGGREGWLLTAIGDDHGVVIVAPAGRGWVPVGLPAQPQPTMIIAAGSKSRDVYLPEGPYRIRTVVMDVAN
jgi:hypothetical protein